MYRLGTFVRKPVSETSAIRNVCQLFWTNVDRIKGVHYVYLIPRRGDGPKRAL
jgi:hypothetical protein